MRSVHVSYVFQIGTLLTSELCYLTDAVLVAFEIRRSTDVIAVWLRSRSEISIVSDAVPMGILTNREVKMSASYRQNISGFFRMLSITKTDLVQATIY
jgi:hypothetical protein